MSGLSAFLAQNAIKVETEEVIVSKRFVDNGKPVKWLVISITSGDDELLRKQHTKRMPIPGKKNAFQPVTDYDSYLATLAVKCTKFPNLHDVDLQTSYGVMGAEALLKKMLLPGEYSNYLQEIQRVNGFDLSLEDTVEEAKN